MNARLASVLPSALALAVVACGGASGRSGFEEPAEPGTGAEGTPAPAEEGDFSKDTPEPGDPPELSEVFGHSAKTLFRLDPKTKEVTVVGDFAGCKNVIDIALDADSTIIGASYEELYRIDKTTAECTLIATGNYPNSLSFVPKGTVDPEREALVGYNDGTYVRIDPQSGAVTTLGALGNNLRSSGDIVSVKGGKTYLTVKDVGFKGACTQSDCLVEVDPVSGAAVTNLGAIGHKNVFGLSFWAGKIYGFNDAGVLIEVTVGAQGGVSTVIIPIPQSPADLEFWGAGSSTSAPLVPPPQ